MSTVVVTGAPGFVGSHVVPALLQAGHRVIAVAHGAESGATLLGRLEPAQRAQVEVRVADVTDAASLPAALVSADAVVHLAAIPRDWDGGASLRLVNTEGTRNVLAAARAAGIRRFIHLGAMGVADEPELHYASSKARAIALVRDSGLDWTVLSPSVMYGPRDGFFNILAGLVRWSPGLVPITGRGTARFQPLSIDDFARAVVRSLEDSATIGREYLLGGPGYWTYREIMVEVLRGMGSAGSSSRCPSRSSAWWPVRPSSSGCRSRWRPTSSGSSGWTTSGRSTRSNRRSGSSRGRWTAP